MDPVKIVITEIEASEVAISDICKAANKALNGFFMAALTSDPSWAKNLALSKFLTKKIFYTLCRVDAN